MSEGGKWTPGKIILLILAILAGLCIVCGGLGYFVMGDKIKGGVEFGMNVAHVSERLVKEFGPHTAFQMIPEGQEMIIAVGVEGELTPERVVEVQDKTWKIIADVAAKDGFVPMKELAVGTPGKPGERNGGGSVANWTKNIVSVEELVKRTGVAAPPISQLMKDAFGKGDGNVHIEVKTDDSKDEPKEDGGGKPGGK